MARVETGSRLHFGLISLAAEGESWPDRAGAPALPARRFGGAGLTIDAPGVAVRVEESARWAAEGPLAARALDFARRVAGGQDPRRVVVERAAPEHAGLGTGTQLALAVARAVLRSYGRDEPAGELARRVGRGRRSALGVHGFDAGGFLVDGGKGAGDALAPLLARVAFPAAWRVLLIVPEGAPGLTGERERAAFARLEQARSDATGELCRLVLLGLLPALVESDLAAFGEALFDFNARSGELFAPVQGDVYASAEIAAAVAWLRNEGVRGAGQSSWGPAVFGIVEDAERGDWLLRRARAALPHATAWLTAARNEGAISRS